MIVDFISFHLISQAATQAKRLESHHWKWRRSSNASTCLQPTNVACSSIQARFCWSLSMKVIWGGVRPHTETKRGPKKWFTNTRKKVILMMGQFFRLNSSSFTAAAKIISFPKQNKLRSWLGWRLNRQIRDYASLNSIFVYF